MPDDKQTTGTRDLTANTAAYRLRNRGRQIDAAVERERSSSRSAKPSRRHPSSRGTRYVDPDKYREGEEGEKSYGAPMGTQSERNKRRRNKDD
jgi:hypothetical protein